MQLNDSFHAGKSESGTGDEAGGVPALIAAEEAVEIGLLDPAPRVGHFEVEVLAIDREAYRDGPVRGRVAQRIVHEIFDHALRRTTPSSVPTHKVPRRSRSTRALRRYQPECRHSSARSGDGRNAAVGIPSRRMRNRKVLGDKPSRVAAPLRPSMTPPLSASID